MKRLFNILIVWWFGCLAKQANTKWKTKESEPTANQRWDCTAPPRS